MSFVFFSLRWFIMALLTPSSFFFAQEPLRSPKGIVFDFGGVIATSDNERIRKEIASAFHCSNEETDRIMLQLKPRSWNGCNERQFWESIACSLQQPLPDTWISHFHDVMKQAVQEIPGSIRLIQSLRKQGIELALLSNTRKDKAQILREAGYYDYFSHIVLSCDGMHAKPDPEIFQTLLDKLHLPAKDCLYIDNKGDNCKTASQLGFDTILFTTIEQLIQELHKRNIHASSSLP